ncbi:amidohydrolase family protein [Aggregatilineales bacterium SYSU G02658]
MTYDTLIVNGQVVMEHSVERLSVAVRSGRIVALLAAEDTHLDHAREVIDAGGGYVLPGAIDIHFHCRAPAYPARGDFATETRAAAAGGVTTVFEMPISKPCCATGDIFQARKQLGQENAYVNFGLYGAPGLLDPREIDAMVAAGAIAWKIFQTSAPAGRSDEFEGLCLPDASQQWQALKLVAPTQLPTVIHAENDDLLTWHTAQLVAAGRSDIRAHGESRPPHVEALGIAQILSMNEHIGASVHIAHVSSAAALNTIRRWQRDGYPVTGETCPHYLFFTEADMERVGPYAKINPPLRQQSDQDALWQGLRDGSLIAVTTDHSPFTVEEKERARTDIWRTPPGAPGVEELLLGMLHAAHEGRVTLLEAVRLISTNGAKRFNLYPRKGVIRVGSDADLVIYDPTTPTTIQPEKLFSQSRGTDKLYEGMTFCGSVRRTLVNGRTVFVDGQIVGEPGWGQFVTPEGL